MVFGIFVIQGFATFLSLILIFASAFLVYRRMQEASTYNWNFFLIAVSLFAVSLASSVVGRFYESELVEAANGFSMLLSALLFAFVLRTTNKKNHRLEG